MFRLLAPLAAHTKLLTCAGVCATSLCAAPFAVHAFQGPTTGDHHPTDFTRNPDPRDEADRFRDPRTHGPFGPDRFPERHEHPLLTPTHERFSTAFHHHHAW
jgi:hypothetical protein